MYYRSEDKISLSFDICSFGLYIIYSANPTKASRSKTLYKCLELRGNTTAKPKLLTSSPVDKPCRRANNYIPQNQFLSVFQARPQNQIPSRERRILLSLFVCKLWMCKGQDDLFSCRLVIRMLAHDDSDIHINVQTLQAWW